MKPLDYIFTVLFSASIFWISYFTTQDAFVLNFSLYTVAFGSFLALYKRASIIGFKSLLFITIGLHLIGLFSFPSLSPDWSRFLWDGELITRAIHPYAYLPKELIVDTRFESSLYLKELYAEITPLSVEHYSCYPSVNQFYFFLAAFFSDNVLVNLVIMRLSMLITLGVGVVYALKLLKKLELNRNSIWLFALNPFVIIELTNNLHFEGVVVSFLVIALYYVFNNKRIKASFFWALAVGVKLTPLLILPYFYRYLGFRKSVRFFPITLLSVLILLGIVLWPNYLQNFSQSLALYFSNFEFNASVFSLVKTAFYSNYGWETIRVIGPWLSKISLTLIVVYSLFYKPKTRQQMIQAMLFGFTIYLLFSSTVHPWYIAIPLGLSIFTPYKSFVLWSFTVMLSYSFYKLGNTSITIFLTILEYVSFIVCLLIEVVRNKKKTKIVYDNLLST